MKIRYDYVTNSSSSSFVVKLGVILKNGEIVNYEAFAPDDGGGVDYGHLSIDRNVFNKSKDAQSIEALLEILENAVTYDDYEKDYHFDPEDFQLYKNLKAKSYTKDDYDETASGMGRKKDDIDDGRSVPYSKSIVIFDKALKKKAKSLDDVESVFIEELHTASGEYIDGQDFDDLDGNGNVAESIKKKELNLKSGDIKEEKSCGWSW